MEKGRRQLSLLALSERSLLKGFLAPLYSFLLSAFFLFGCEKNPFAGDGLETPVALVINSSLESPSSKAIDWKLMERLDIFVFDEGEDGDLDYYCAMDHYPSGGFSVISSGGKKHLVAIANRAFSEEELDGIWTMKDLKTLEVSMRDDTPEYPMMEGDTSFTAGEKVELNIEPYLSRICYNIDDSAIGLEGLSVYLTGVNSRTELFEKSIFTPSDILNSGRLREDDLETMRYPRMICNELGTHREGVLYCYPNSTVEESAGEVLTRLVIEGKINGETRFFPICLDIRERNTSYKYDLTLSGKGCASPEDTLQTYDGKKSIEVLPSEYIEGHIGDTLRIEILTTPDSAKVTFDDELLDDDTSRGIYDYAIDGHKIELFLTGKGMGCLMAYAGDPINDSVLVVVICE